MSATAVAQQTSVARTRADRLTLAAFLVATLLGGIGPVMTRITLREMPPMWGGALRFGVAALLVFTIVRLRGLPAPRGRALLGSLLFGALGMGLSTALIYRGLVEVPAGVSQVILGLVPVETMVLAAMVGLERLRVVGLAGAAIAVAGVAVVFEGQLSASVALGGLLSILGAGLSIAGTTVVLKWFPAVHPLSSASVALPVGASVFLFASTLFGEPRVLPHSAPVWLAMTWLTLIGTIGVMTAFLFVISRMSASASSYQFLLLPLVTVVASSVVAGEQISLGFLAGTAIVLVGVYIGIVRPARNAREPAVIPAPAEFE
jgi:drug/metabolite transporter (DMT)-like permease